MILNGSAYPVGLDISDQSIKLIQLDKVRDKIKIQAIGKINLAKNVIENGEILNKSELIKSIKRLLDNPLYGKVSSREIIASLPESKTFVKLIEIEKSPNPLEEVISHEIEKHVPMAINEIYYDWQIIKEDMEKYLVLIGAAPRKIVNDYTDMLDEAKLSPMALEIEPVAICRSLLMEENPKYNTKYTTTDAKGNFAIIDIGANHTSMTYYSKNTILFTMSIPLSGEQVTKNIAATIEINKEQAEKAKIVCGLDTSKAQGVIKDILANLINDLEKKIKESLVFYKDHYEPAHGPLSSILLCGGGANIKNLDKIINESTGIEIKLGDALTNISAVNEKFTKILSETHILDADSLKKDNTEAKEEVISISQDTSLTYATAIGLALRNIFIDEL